MAELIRGNELEAPHILMMPSFYSDEEIQGLAALFKKTSDVSEERSFHELTVADPDNAVTGERAIKIVLDGVEFNLNEGIEIPSELLARLNENVWLVKVGGNFQASTFTALLYFLREKINGGTFILQQNGALDDDSMRRASLSLLSDMKRKVQVDVSKVLAETEPGGIDRRLIRQFNRYLIHDDPVCLLEISKRILADPEHNIEKVAAEILCEFLQARIDAREWELAIKTLERLKLMANTAGEIEDEDFKKGLLLMEKLGLFIIKGDHFTQNSAIMKEFITNSKFSDLLLKIFKN